MALPSTVGVPYVTSQRRYLWLAVQRSIRERSDTDAALRGRRLEVTGTALPATFPSRTALLTAGVLAVEEVVGADVPELRSYGLTTPQAERLILWLERLTMQTFAYGPRVGQFYDEDELTLMASGARTASTTSDVYEVGDRGTLRLDLDLTAVSGTNPTMHVQIETRKTYGSGSWRVVDAFPIKTTTGSERRSMSGLDRFARAVCTIGGTNPSFTFSLGGEAV